MRLSEFRKANEEFTGKASEIVRQLILAGIGVIWLFKTPSLISGQNSLDSFLIWPLIFLCIAAMCDLMQYVLGGKIWGKFFRDEEKKAKDANKIDSSSSLDPDVKAPRKFSKRIGWLYNAKICLMVLAYVFIIIFLIRHIRFI